MRKITQICATATPDTEADCREEWLFALCNDGTVWQIEVTAVDPQWLKFPDIPQDGDEK